MHDTSPAPPALYRALGYSFRDQSLLQAALIHTSYVNERPGRGLESNERLEFLGDAVLGVVVAHRLYELRPESPEGELTVVRAWLVRQSTLARWARQISLGQHLLLGRGEARGGGRDRPALLARGFEAVIGSIYLDGGLDAARAVLLPLIDGELQTGFSPQRVVDAKSRLQQVTQARFEQTPVYNLVDDIIFTGGTLTNMAHHLTAAGARSVRAVVTHGLFTGDAVASVGSSPLAE